MKEKNSAIKALISAAWPQRVAGGVLRGFRELRGV